jgi:hypothetical protein
MPELAPPTPAIPLSSLLARADLGLRQVAGPPAEQVAVHWVHTSEMADPVPYLLGGELLLTAGVHVASAADSAGYLDRYVARTVEAGAAALGFGLAPVHETTPSALVSACDRHGLPLVEVPPPTPFAAVARAVWQAMAEARHRELRRVAEAQQGLATAAARPDPVPAVLRQLAHHLGGRAALLDPRGAELYAAGAATSAEVRTAMQALAAVVRPGRPGAPASAADSAGTSRLAAYALAGGPAGTGLVLVLAAERSDPADHAIAGVAAVLLSLLTGAYQGASDAGRTAALVRLLLGDAPERAAAVLAGAAPGEEPLWTVVHARRRSATPGVQAAGELATALGTPLVDAEDGTLRALVPAEREVPAQPGWTFGVSAAVPARELPTADAQAAGALRRAVANRSALVGYRAAGTGIAALVAPAEARAYARSRLAPIQDAPALTETLRTWISLHGSWDRTAVALQVHRNTVRQRIARAAELLEADLDDPDVRTDLWIALRYM